MFSRGSPENVFASVVVCDERMLQTKPFGNRADARAFESSFGELLNGRVQDRAPRLKRALLFGSLARAPPPLRGRFQFCILRHIHWLTRLQEKNHGASCANDDCDQLDPGYCFIVTSPRNSPCPATVLFVLELGRVDPVAARDEARRPRLFCAQPSGKPEVILDSVSGFFQLGTNNERRFNPENRIALQKFVAVEE